MGLFELIMFRFHLLLACALSSGKCTLGDDLVTQAVCHLRNDPASKQNVVGVIKFTQIPGQDMVVNVNISGLDPVAPGSPQSSYLHGFHVHTYGDTTLGCGSTGGHFFSSSINPADFDSLTQTPHGNIVTTFTDTSASLFTDSAYQSIIGRSLVLHAQAGPRLACCVIG